MALFQGTPDKDVFRGTAEDDRFIGRGGNDKIQGRADDDRSVANLSTDGGDKVNLSGGLDTVVLSSDTAGQARLTFTSSEVGNGDALDSDTLAKQDGGLALRLQLDNGSDERIGPVSRYDDEGVSFIGKRGPSIRRARSRQRDPAGRLLPGRYARHAGR